MYQKKLKRLIIWNGWSIRHRKVLEARYPCLGAPTIDLLCVLHQRGGSSPNLVKTNDLLHLCQLLHQVQRHIWHLKTGCAQHVAHQV